MKQPRLMSLVESAINIAVGFGIGLGAQMIFLPLLGVAIDLQQNVAFALIMTAISMARSYLLRRLFEALHIRTPLSPAMLAVMAERRAQVEREGYHAAHDDGLPQGELAAAGAVYALNGRVAQVPIRVGNQDLTPIVVHPVSFYPWPRPMQIEGTRRNWIKAGALIIAEIEKLDRRGKRAGVKV